jgi:hypothetical protein
MLKKGWKPNEILRGGDGGKNIFGEYILNDTGKSYGQEKNC